MKDESKLPKWAQQELRRLRNNIETLNKCLKEKSGEPTGTGVDVDVLNPHKALYWLKDSARITFYFQDHRIEVYRDHDLLCIHGDEPLVVFPRVTNVINVGFTNF
jgi:hypothetical protein